MRGAWVPFPAPGGPKRRTMLRGKYLAKSSEVSSTLGDALAPLIPITPFQFQHIIWFPRTRFLFNFCLIVPKKGEKLKDIEKRQRSRLIEMTRKDKFDM